MKRQHKLIGVCGVRIYEQNVMPFLQILKRECEQKGFNLIAFSGSSCSLEDSEEIVGQYQIIDLIRQVELSALVILTETIKNESTIQRLVDIAHEKNIPVFSLDRKVAGCYNLLMKNGDCFEQIVRHVVEEHGCRLVNMIAGDKDNSFSEERIGIYRKVLEENGIPFEPERIGYGNFWEQPVAGLVKQFFESDLPFPEAIVCANDIMAHAAISILNEYGMECPEDIIVTGYDGTKDGAYFFPTISTGAPDYEQMVKRLFEELDRCFDNNKIEPCDIIVPVIMKLRQSCGCEEKVIHKKDRRIARLLTEIGNGKWHMKSMHHMLSDTFGKKRIEDIIPVIMKHMDIWFEFYRYICLKSELLQSYDVSDEYTDMTCILDANYGKFGKIGEKWRISEFHDHVDKILSEDNINSIIVHLLISGKDVYGFVLDGFDELVDWQIKQSDEFAMFLSHILHTVVHNYKLNELNENLYKANREVAQMSLHDSMTGIYNRRGGFYEIRQLISQKENLGKYLYLFMVDMDGLKYINDNFGHAEGDFAIITLAKVLNNMGKGKAVCARVGGDEFIFFYVEDKEQSYSVDDFNKEMDCLLMNEEGLADKPYSIAASAGMICKVISEDIDVDEMINSADDKMYRRKAARKRKR